jgi:hypothetical protein
MSRQDEIETDCAMPPGTDVIEIRLLLPTSQFSALEATATRSDRSVAALLRSTIGDFLRSHEPCQRNM